MPEHATDARFPNDDLSASGLTVPQAAAYLATTAPDSPARRSLGRAIGGALVRLAAADAEAVLRLVLTPDPGEDDIVWTVRCFETGGIVPALVRDFPACADAVAHLGACDDDAHLFAELVASSPLGLRWTALTRTGVTVVFELPDPTTLKDANGRHPDALHEAFERWDQRLASWELGADAPAAGATSSSARPTVDPPAPAVEADPSAPDPLTTGRLVALEGEVRALRLESATLHTALHVMAERFSSVVALVGELHAVNAALCDSVEGLRADVRTLAGVVADVESRTTMTTMPAMPARSLTTASTMSTAPAAHVVPPAGELAVAVPELAAAVSFEPTALAGLQVGVALHEALRELLAGLHDDVNVDMERLEAALSAEVAAVEGRLGLRIEHLATGLWPEADRPATPSLPVRVRVS